MIVLCDADGTVDMTPQAIAARTSIPLKIISKGLEALAREDPYSRTPGSDGRRIELIDEHRPWGWTIVNHTKYQRLQDSDTIRAQTKERVQRHREKKRTVTNGNGSKRHTDTYTYTDTPIPPSEELAVQQAAPPAPPPDLAVEILPLRGGMEFRVLQSFVTELDRLYPSVDIPATLREMRGWCLGNPERLKTRRGIKRFMTRWLADEQEKHGG